jgi:hypothetical protein
MRIETAGRIQGALVLLLLLWAVILHGLGFFSAGALWRDEANSIQQARLPSWSSLWRSLDYDSFPALYPSALRLWSGSSWRAGDEGLRVFGLLVGLALLASVYFVARLLGNRRPVVVLVLLAANSVWISEGDSIRPYGLGLILLLWTYGFMGACLARPSFLTLALATLGSVLCVQTIYTNALWVGVFCLCAAGVSASRGEKWRSLRFFIPGICAALSLLIYAGTLQRAREWAVILHYRVDWLQFIKGIAQSHSGLVPALWLGFLALAVRSVARAIRTGASDSPRRAPVFCYLLSVFVLAALVQILFVELAGVPPFPRYFLPPAAFAAFAIEAAFERSRPPLGALAVIAALALTAWPSWSWMSMRHSNVDRVAGLLAGRAAPQDLIVVSPWFLNTSFQRYYRGPCPWITVPDLDRQPMMRYDLLKQAMLGRRPESGVARELRLALERGGAIWFVSQARWSNLARAQAPETPRPPASPGGPDYARFRSYWERDVEYRLNAGWVLSERHEPSRNVWDEENLILTRWSKKLP